ncbi:MAG: DinB family protein [Planctomycetales bacterium]|nr:DinB family protein [Planctomycetales bacterium]
MSRQRIEAAVKQMEQVRGVLKGYLEDMQPHEWFGQPAGGVTHVGWQVGHLAAAQYMLHIGRVRGVLESDAEFAPPDFLKRYGRGSTPDPDPAANASPEVLCQRLDEIFARGKAVLAEFTDEQLDAPLENPHPVFKTRLAAVEFCPVHESMHLGQIMLLRRLLGRAPKW